MAIRQLYVCVVKYQIDSRPYETGIAVSTSYTTLEDGSLIVGLDGLPLKYSNSVTGRPAEGVRNVIAAPQYGAFNLIDFIHPEPFKGLPSHKQPIKHRR
jgi:hypothetical protein